MCSTINMSTQIVSSLLLKQFIDNNKKGKYRFLFSYLHYNIIYNCSDNISEDTFSLFPEHLHQIELIYLINYYI